MRIVCGEWRQYTKIPIQSQTDRDRKFIFFLGVNTFIQFIGDPIECKPSSESQISEKMFEFHCWIHGTYHRGDKNGRIEGRLCVKNYVIFFHY